MDDEKFNMTCKKNIIIDFFLFRPSKSPRRQTRVFN